MDGQAPEPTGYIRSRGMKFPRDPDILQGKILRMLRRDAFESKETNAALRVVRKGDVVVELGGGIGYMSTLVATKRAAASVHVFEANPELIPYMKSVHAANGVTNAHITNGVLGSREGKVDFYIRDPMLGSSMEVLEGEVDPPSVKVDMLNAKQTFAQIGANVLICDIEGAEAELIPMLNLTGLRAAIIETHPQWIGPEGVNKVFRALMDAGMAYYHRGSEGKVIAFRRDW